MKQSKLKSQSLKGDLVGRVVTHKEEQLAVTYWETMSDYLDTERAEEVLTPTKINRSSSKAPGTQETTNKELISTLRIRTYTP